MKTRQAAGISPRLADNRAALEELLGANFDVVLRPLTSPAGQELLVVFADGLVKSGAIAENVVRPLLGYCAPREKLGLRDIGNIKKRVLSAVDVRESEKWEEVVGACLRGDTALLLDGVPRALIIQTRGWPQRGVEAPRSRQAVRGPQEGFTETLLANAALLRRKLRDPRLVLESFEVGSMSHTDVCVAYLDGVAKEGLVEKVRARIAAIDVEYVLESGHVEQLIEDGPRSIFATVGNSEKPDEVAAKLMKGRVAVLVDGSPFALTVPFLFVEKFRTGEDYYARPYYANLLRVLRMGAYLLAILLPALYVALLTYHQEMIPDEFLGVLIRAAQGVPLPVAAEVFLILLLYELLREAQLRLPVALSSTVGIAGVLIIGDAAVAARLISGPAVVVGAMTFIAAATVNTAMDEIVLLRLIMLVLASLFGIYGVLAGQLMALAHLCALHSFGTPYLLPLAPFSRRGMRDGILRGHIGHILGGKEA